MSHTALRVCSAALAAMFAFSSPARPVLAQSWSGGGAGYDTRKGSAVKWYQNGLRLHQGGDVTGAIEMYKKALAIDPKNKWAHYYLANAYAQTGNLNGALMSFRTCLNNDYNFVEARNDMAAVMRKQENREEALAQFRQCIKINPRYPFPYYHIGCIMQEKGDLDQAIENYNTAVRLKPDYVEAHRDLGLAIFEKVKAGGTGVEMSQALQQLQMAAQLVPNDPMIRFHMATLYLNDGKLDEGESELRRCLMIDPRHAAARFELSKLRYFRGDLDRCILEARECEKINPTYSEGRGYPKVDPINIKCNLAVSYEIKGKLIDSVEIWKEIALMANWAVLAQKHVLEIEKILKRDAKKKKKPLPYDPEEIDALVQKGITQFDDGDLEGAKSSFMRALELNPQSFEAMQNLGLTLEAMGDLNGAMEKFQKAVAIKPNYDGAYYNMAYLLEKLNLPADAGLMYQKFHEVSVIGRYPYDPRHIVALQNEEARLRARQEQMKRRGY